MPLQTFDHGLNSSNPNGRPLRQPPALVPMESNEAIRSLIKMLIQNFNIVVITSAGSGDYITERGIDLDTYRDYSNRRVFNRSSAEYDDSGSIMVGAGRSANPHGRIDSSNFGSRIDCYSWGENVLSTGVARDQYSNSIGGTSIAAAIVAGAAIVTQGVSLVQRRLAYSSRELRNILSDRAINTPSANPALDRIGVMPNLRRIIEEILGQPLGPDHPVIPRENWLILGGITVDGAGIVIRPDGHPIPVGPWEGLLRSFNPHKRDLLMGLALTELSSLIHNPENRSIVDQAGLKIMNQALQQIQKEIGL